MKPKRKKVLVAVSLAHGSGRDILSGLFRFLDAKNDWNVKLLQGEQDVAPEIIRNAPNDGVDGLIVSIEVSDATKAEIVRSRLPMILVGIRDARLECREAPSRLVCNDNAAIGRLAAAHFAECGAFNSFGLVGSQGEGWSRERGAAFREAVRKAGGRVSEFPGTAAEGSPQDIREIGDWLRTLPKPAAVFAVYDSRAANVLEAAQKSRLLIPTQVSILGSDNDEYLTNHTAPPLSSILPGHVEMGFRAGEELAKLMHRRRGGAKPTIVPPKCVIMRESTGHATPAAALVRRAREFIRENACSAIRTDDLARHLGVSRSCIEHRFSEIEGRPVRAFIEDCRLDRVRQHLKNTNWNVIRIASTCGFSSANRLSHLFKLRYGISIRDWRTQERG